MEQTYAGSTYRAARTARDSFGLSPAVLSTMNDTAFSRSSESRTDQGRSAGAVPTIVAARARRAGGAITSGQVIEAAKANAAPPA